MGEGSAFRDAELGERLRQSLWEMSLAATREQGERWHLEHALVELQTADPREGDASRAAAEGEDPPLHLAAQLDELKEEIGRLRAELAREGRPVSSGLPRPSAQDLGDALDSAVLSGGAWAFSPGGASASTGEADLAAVLAEQVAAARRGGPESASGLLSAVLSAKQHLPHEQLSDVELRSALIEAEVAALLSVQERGRAGSSGDAIVIDARCLQDSRYAGRGIGRQARALLDAMAPGTRLVALVDEHLPGLSPEVAVRFDHVVHRPWELDLASISLFLQPSPMTADLSSVAPLLLAPGLRTVCLLLDFIPLEHSQHYLADPLDRLRYEARLLALQKYDHAVAISKTVAEKARAVLDWPEGRVTVIGASDGLGLDETATAPETSGRRYVLAPTGDDARKNLLVAVAAAAFARNAGEFDLQLRVVGRLSADRRVEAQALAGRLGYAESDVVFAEDLTDRELASLYRSASVVIVPSYAEGFSLPVAEAVARGVPVVASDIDVHRELLGEGWWLRDAGDPVGLGEAVLQALLEGPSAVAEQARSLGDLAVPARVAARFRDVLSKLASELATHPPATTSSRPRVAILSPFPPQQSGISDFTAFTAVCMSALADVVIYSAADHPDTRTGLEVRPLTAEPYLLTSTFDAVVAVIGNSHFHVPMLEYLERFGGGALAHDNRLVELYSWWRGPLGAAAVMSLGGGVVTEQDVLDGLADLERLRDLGFGEVARASRPLIVHSAHLAERVAAETDLLAHVVPFVPYNFPRQEVSTEARAAARRKLGFRQGRVQLVSFGEVDIRTKAADVLVGAVGWLEDWGIDVALHFVGVVEPTVEEQLTELAVRSRVRERVFLHGRVDPSALETMLLACDIGIQLRTHSLLTLSGALTDCLLFGLPTLTTVEMARDSGSTSYIETVPASAGPFLVAEALAGMIIDLAEDRSAKIEEERLAFMASHSGSDYARGFLQALGLLRQAEA